MKAIWLVVVIPLVSSGCITDGCEVAYVPAESGDGPGWRTTACGVTFEFQDGPPRAVVRDVPPQNGAVWSDFSAMGSREGDVHVAFMRRPTTDDPGAPVNLGKVASGQLVVGQYIMFCGDDGARVGIIPARGGGLSWDGPHLPLDVCVEPAD